MTNNNDKNLAICYLNSMGRSPDAVSIDQQRESARKYAADHGLTIAREYTEQHIPGLKRKSELKRMLDELDEIHPVALIIWGTNLLSRKPFDLAMIKRVLRGAACEIHTILKPDPGNVEDVYLMEVLLNTLVRYPINCSI